jgi:hypothetical protein
MRAQVAPAEMAHLTDAQAADIEQLQEDTIARLRIHCQHALYVLLTENPFRQADLIAR